MIIAELCQNHLGDSKLLADMVYAAKEAGAWGCKIQSFFAEDLSDAFASERERLTSLELSWEQQTQFVNLCHMLEMAAITTVYSSHYWRHLKHCKFDAVKVGSAEANRKNLIWFYLLKQMPVFLSTGGQSLASLGNLNQLKAVFHCVSTYPHSPFEANIYRMIELKLKFKNTDIGFSDHTDPLDRKWDWPSKIAMMLGALYIEKHFTLLARDKTKDGKVSIDQKQLAELCRFDKLEQSDRIAESPLAGVLICQQKDQEVDLVKRYQGRWAMRVKSSASLGLERLGNRCIGGSRNIHDTDA
jgi:sialic acid synthase SpsE